MEKGLQDYPGRSRRDHDDDGLPSYQAETSQFDDVGYGLPSYREATEGNGQEKEAACTHYWRSGCQMTLYPKRCCACSDQRPETELYSKYNPISRRVEMVPRWESYCPSCREYFDPKAEIRNIMDQQMWKEKRAQSLAKERDEKFLGLGRWIHAGKEAAKSFFET
ncbi:hypothetical protein F5B20DRAFT_552211 [Whalleya microplaca]|nr:hypothetical protein F5B20DRAFT_552211 [Whalleya microplaca]